jgi:hypothetical protein
VIEQHDFVDSGLALADEDVARVRIAVHVPELVDHVRVHLEKITKGELSRTEVQCSNLAGP